jgi:hypothetical protein
MEKFHKKIHVACEKWEAVECLGPCGGLAVCWLQPGRTLHPAWLFCAGRCQQGGPGFLAIGAFAPDALMGAFLAWKGARFVQFRVVL